MQSATWLSAKATELAGTGWQDDVDAFLRNDAGRALCARLDARLAQGIAICPQDPFRALKLTPREAVKVVILGQDPYHGEGEAHGLAFSVARGVKIPVSLHNICTEITRDLGVTHAPHGNLEHWARQGVLLLNTTLTVRKDAAGSHAGRGWEMLTTAILRHLGQPGPPRAFLLWGKPAQGYARFVAQPPHLVLATSHPSGLSAWRGFRGCGHFSAANRFLAEAGRGTIDWSIPE